MKNWTAVQHQHLLELPALLEHLPLLIKDLGFCFYAYTFICPTQRDNKTNYPAGWLNHCEKHGHTPHEPIDAHCRSSSLPLLWTAQTFRSAPEHWEIAQACGLRHGWTQPLHDRSSRSSLSIVRPHVSVSIQELYEKAALVMWLGELLHRASIHFFSQPSNHQAPDSPVCIA
ncbi:autoinducer binding domain-containing protein [Pseudomonas sp. H9]|uniref:autoinducer binding domain-containing protein n=1 Tax=Pseudomonas sp. H9 TaxID=483968 RepID=UPI0014046014|nr:autoinducer binding domain-containing protein [Pseudomonas sp. H9]